jgi:hypothetical protein
MTKLTGADCPLSHPTSCDHFLVRDLIGDIDTLQLPEHLQTDYDRLMQKVDEGRHMTEEDIEVASEIYWEMK